jgi:hypothetical protein
MTVIIKGMKVGATGFRGPALAYTEAMQLLAMQVVREIEPSYGYCIGVLGWSGAWASALIEVGILYTLLLTHPEVGSTWHPVHKGILTNLTNHADNVLYRTKDITKMALTNACMDLHQYLVEHSEALVAFSTPGIIDSSSSYICKNAKELGKPVQEAMYNSTGSIDTYRIGCNGA